MIFFLVGFGGMFLGLVLGVCVREGTEKQTLEAARVKKQLQAAQHPEPRPARPLPPEYELEFEPYKHNTGGYVDGDYGVALGTGPYGYGSPGELMFHPPRVSRPRFNYTAYVTTRSKPRQRLGLKGHGVTVEEAAKAVVKRYWDGIDYKTAEAEGIARAKATLESSDDIQEQLDKR